MTPSRNTRSYTLRSVPSSPGRSFFETLQWNCKSVTICGNISTVSLGSIPSLFSLGTTWQIVNIVNIVKLMTQVKIAKSVKILERVNLANQEKIVKGVNLVKSKTSELVLRNQTKWDKPELCSGSQKSWSENVKGTSATDHLAFNPLLLVASIFVWFWSSNLCYNPVSFQFDVSILFFDLVVQNVCQEFRFPPLFDHFGKFFLQEICFCSFDLDHLVRPLVIFDNCAKISDYFLKSLSYCPDLS